MIYLGQLGNLQEVDDAIVRDGLIGVGVVGGVLGFAALVIGGLLSGRR